MGKVFDLQANIKGSSRASILYCGHSSVIVTTEKGTRIAIDPWFKGNPSCPKGLHSPGPVDVIALTHGHADHTGSVISLAKETGATIFATFELAMLMIKEGIPDAQVQPMNKGGTVEIPETEGLAITLTKAYHSSSYDASDGNTYYAGEACGVVIKLESGKFIYHAGDTCLFDDMRQIGVTYYPEVALLPIGDRFTMGPKEAALAADLIKPKVTIPIHYGTFDSVSGTPEDFEEQLKKKDMVAVILEPGKHFVL